MPISSNSSFVEKGFTLVEILVVMLLIGLSLGLVFRMDYSNGPQQLKNTARQFSSSAELILDEAVLGGDDWGIDLFTRQTRTGTVYGYRWLRRQGDTWQQAIPVGMDDFEAVQELEQGLVIELEIEGQSYEPGRKVDLDDAQNIPADFSPDIWLYSNHETTSFTATFMDEVNGNVIVISDILGRIRLLASAGES